jgi:anti-sigma B factor antagonist
MFVRTNAVSVHQVSSEISSTSQLEFLRRLEVSAKNGHPRFVLDCSKLQQIGPAEIRFLLGCLEEVMKHNGDVRLATLRPDIKVALYQVGMDRLFEMYETTESAVASYQLSPASTTSLSSSIANEDQTTEYAA